MIEPLQDAKNRVMAQYEPRGNVHTDPVENKYVSVSMLTSKTARECVEQMLAEHAGHGPDVPKYWSYKGNALGDRALEHIEHKEIRFTVPLDTDGWVLAGNCDGIELIGGESVVVYEHKAYGHPTSQKIEVAKRQGGLYLAMGWHNVSALKNNIFGAAAYVGAGASSFNWPDYARPVGVLVCVAPNYPPAEVHEYDFGTDECREILHFYKEKAEIVARAVEMRDPNYAEMKWDLCEPGSMEFARAIEEASEPYPETTEAIVRYSKAQKLFKDAEAEKKEAQSMLMACLDKQGVNRVSDENFKVSVVEVGEKEVPSYVRRGYRFVKVQEVKE